MTNPEVYNRVVTVAVDVQNDFCPGGALEVERGDEVIPPINAVHNWTVNEAAGEAVFTRDWHPAQTKHFEEFGGKWPAHCLADTPGAEFHKDLKINPAGLVLSKGQSTEDDGYSGFEATDSHGRTLEDLVTPDKEERVALVIGGLATDYCVKATVLDACKLADRINVFAYPHKLDVFVIQDAVRAVNIEPDDDSKAIGGMKLAGARFVNSQDILNGNVIRLNQGVEV